MILSELGKYRGKPRHDNTKMHTRRQYCLVRPASVSPKMQNVTVKVKYKSPSSLSRHLDYLLRDDAGKNGKGAVLIDEKGHVKRSDFDVQLPTETRHFRFMVSPENGKKLDMENYTKVLVRRLEKSLGKKLTWGAVIHYDKPKPHAHIIIRGVNDLTLDPSFIKDGIRAIARDEATIRLGERTKLDIMRSKEREIAKERFTSLDYSISKKSYFTGRGLFVKHGDLDPHEKRRMEYLSNIGLAYRTVTNGYNFVESYKYQLYKLSKNNDIQDKLSHAKKFTNEKTFIVHRNTSLKGSVIKKGIEDEISDTPYVIIKTNSKSLFYASGKQYENFKSGDKINIKNGKVFDVNKENDLER